MQRFSAARLRPWGANKLLNACSQLASQQFSCSLPFAGTLLSVLGALTVSQWNSMKWSAGMCLLHSKSSVHAHILQDTTQHCSIVVRNSTEYLFNTSLLCIGLFKGCSLWTAAQCSQQVPVDLLLTCLCAKLGDRMWGLTSWLSFGDDFSCGSPTSIINTHLNTDTNQAHKHLTAHLSFLLWGKYTKSEAARPSHMHPHVHGYTLKRTMLIICRADCWDGVIADCLSNQWWYIICESRVFRRVFRRVYSKAFCQWGKWFCFSLIWWMSSRAGTETKLSLSP